MCTVLRLLPIDLAIVSGQEHHIVGLHQIQSEPSRMWLPDQDRPFAIRELPNGFTPVAFALSPDNHD